MAAGKMNPLIYLHAGKGGAKLRGRPQTPEHAASRSASVAATLAATPRECVECKGSFLRTNAAQRYCSGQCWNRAARRKRDGRHKIQVSPTAYAGLVERFGRECGVCFAPSAGAGRGKGRLAVDHCHTTGTIRGLLCHRCNTAIGLMKDDPAALDRAASYLRKAQT